MFKEDYASAGFKMLPCIDPTGRRMFRQAMLYATALIGIALLLPALHLTGDVYLFGSVVAGAALLVACIGMAETRTVRDARRALLVSVIYLPVLLLLIVVDAGYAGHFPMIGK